jgi:hypothetical protein
MTSSAAARRARRAWLLASASCSCRPLPACRSVSLSSSEELENSFDEDFLAARRHLLLELVRGSCLVSGDFLGNRLGGELNYCYRQQRGHLFFFAWWWTLRFLMKELSFAVVHGNDKALR